VLPVDVTITREVQENPAPWLQIVMVVVSYPGTPWLMTLLVVGTAAIFWLVGLPFDLHFLGCGDPCTIKRPCREWETPPENLPFFYTRKQVIQTSLVPCPLRHRLIVIGDIYCKDLLR